LDVTSSACGKVRSGSPGVPDEGIVELGAEADSPLKPKPGQSPPETYCSAVSLRVAFSSEIQPMYKEELALMRDAASKTTALTQDDFYKVVLSWFALYLLVPLAGGFGLMLLAASSLVSSHPRLQNSLDALGLSIAVTVTITSLINLKFERQIYNSFSIIKGCEDAGITRVFANRDDAVEAIESEIPGARRNLDVLAVAGMDFFLLPHKMVSRLETWIRKEQAGGLSIRILLLDPRSPYAVRRSMIEEGVLNVEAEMSKFDYTGGNLYRDIMGSLIQMERILKENNSAKSPTDLNIRTYNDAPTVMLVRCDEKLFFEQYHCGVTKSEEQSQLRKCVGRRVPVVETTVTSQAGEALMSHFQYVWDRSQARQFKVGCIHWLEKASHDGDWVMEFLRRLQADEDRLSISARERPGLEKAS
jgi:hypothetical protein